MYVVIAGGGKVGANLARALIRQQHEVTLIEVRNLRYALLEIEFEHQVMHGDATEIWVLENAGMARADWCIAVTGDDEDNIVISQVAREKFGIERIVARVNDPRNQPHFDLLEIAPTVSSTTAILRLIEHEVPQHGLIRLLSLQRENIEIVEAEIDEDSPAAGKLIGELDLPRSSLIISVLRDRVASVPRGSTRLEVGDEVLVITEVGQEAELARALGASVQEE